MFYVGHVFSGGFTVIDARDPRNLRPAGFHPAPPNTWNIHLQAADDLLLVVHAKDLWAQFRQESAYTPVVGHPACRGAAGLECRRGHFTT